MKNSWSIAHKIRGNPEAAGVAVLALSAQVFHAQYVFFQSGHSHGAAGVFNAWLYAVAVESAVFFFVLRGWAWVSWLFAMASIGVNVAYYTIAHGQTLGWGFMFDRDLIAQTWFMWLIAIVLPVAVAAFSHATDGHQVTDGSQKATGRPGRSLRDRVVSLVPSSLPWTQGPSVAVQEGDRVLSGPLTRDGLDLDTGKTVSGPDTGKTWEGDMDLGDLGLDEVDLSILGHLVDHSPDTKSGIAQAVNMTPGAMDRMKRGKRTGRLVRLAELGLVQEGPDGWVLVTMTVGGTMEGDTVLRYLGQDGELAQVYTNGHGPK